MKAVKAYEAEVAAGAAWLDENVGNDWHNLIDPGKLQMEFCDNCIKGQLIRNLYDDAYLDTPLSNVAGYPSHLGFDIHSMPGEDTLADDYFSHENIAAREAYRNAEYPKLEEAWVNELKRRAHG